MMITVFATQKAQCKRFANERTGTHHLAHKIWRVFGVGVLLILLISCPQLTSAQDVTAEWHAPDPTAVRTMCIDWLDQMQASERLREKVTQLWPGIETDPESLPNTAAEGADESVVDIDAQSLLDRVARTAALLDADAARLVDRCDQPRSGPLLEDQSWLDQSQLPQPMIANLRLYYARWLAQQRYYDEALAQFEQIEADQVVDPATLYFYQAAVYHRLLDRENGLEAIGRLLSARTECPTRYVAVAELMQGELEILKDESLDHIARRMEDVERRLGLGRAGKKVRDVEDGVVESLDDMIKKLEEQQQQQSSSSSGNSSQSQKPADDSKIMGGKGQGLVEKKPVGNEQGWGNLPPKEREKAMQDIAREFPSHYREIIQQYFRQLATEDQP